MTSDTLHRKVAEMHEGLGNILNEKIEGLTLLEAYEIAKSVIKAAQELSKARQRICET